MLADYRKYFRIARPLSLAARLMHYGRYGGQVDDSRLQDLFLGYPDMVRGYDPNSFSASECGQNGSANPAGTPPAQTQSCPVFDQLTGSRLAVLNAEARVPLLGFLGIIPSRGVPPVELAPFYDMGITWNSAQKASFLGGPRHRVRSTGVSLRINLLGYAVAEFSYVHPMDRPLKPWLWQFSPIPGF